MSKKVLFLILFALITAGFIGYWFYREGMFSKEILRMEILGPQNAKTGEEIEYSVEYKNNGNFVLEQVKLVFQMPENSLTEDGKIRISQNIKDIYPGDQEIIKFKTRLLGKEGDLKTVNASISYVPKNITAPFESDTTFTTKIESTPITLDFDIPSKGEKGKDLQYSLNYFSNIDYPLENLSIKIDPVLGFEFVSSTPASLDGQEWRLQTLNKAQGGRITIKGRINADTDQNLTFNAKLGARINGDFIVIKETASQVQVIQPLLFISQQVNGSSSYIASPGETLNYQIFFRNIGTTPFEDLFMVAKVDGIALDMSTLQAEGGQVQDNMIVWDWKQANQLAHLGVQEEGQVSFNVKVKSDWAFGADSASTEIKDEVNISQITQKFTIKVNSGLTILQGVGSESALPKVGSESTYTISWDIKNYFSDAKNVKVKAMLPQGVSLTGKIMPQDESSRFSFDSASREIVWSAGDIAAGTGVSGDPVSLYFDVLLRPDSSQKGAVAQLVGQATISGENQFTNTIITSKDSAISTSLPVQ